MIPLVKTSTTPRTTDEIHRELGLGKYDPVLAEVWAIKAQINKEANYDVDQILGRLSAMPTPVMRMAH